jgi:hypothetical protein
MGVNKDYVPRTIPGVVQRRQVTLTSAQLLALFTTPVTLIPAPGAGKYISIDEIVGKVYSTGKVAYTGANAVELRYTDGSGAKVTGDLPAAWLNNATDRADRAVPAAVATMVANAPVVAAVPTANPGAGTGTVVFDLLYRVITV